MGYGSAELFIKQLESDLFVQLNKILFNLIYNGDDTYEHPKVETHQGSTSGGSNSISALIENVSTLLSEELKKTDNNLVDFYIKMNRSEWSDLLKLEVDYYEDFFILFYM